MGSPISLHRFHREVIEGATNGMRGRLSNRGFVPTLGCLGILAALLCARTPEAHAVCSRHVVAAMHPRAASPRLDIPNHGEADEGADESPSRPKPCSGALCSGKPAVPISPPLPVGRAPEAIAPRAAPPPYALALGKPLASAERIVRIVMERPPIERPPR
ncbi:MAG: hypothetical protein BGO49_11375 [Planctomycetales bacterium 71-10]|nr:MAG: hypothetical protein BGO49_11375 [Planctomycetales bacterium 71-10]